MIQRKDYLDGKATHRQYYGQFARGGCKFLVLQVVSKEEILSSKDEHLNDIPLPKWDRVFANGCPFWLNTLLKRAGDYPTQAGLVCIAKEAARQIAEN